MATLVTPNPTPPPSADGSTASSWRTPEEQKALDALYPTTARAAASTVTPSAPADVGRVLYGFSTLAHAIESRDADVFAALGEDTAARAARRDTFIEIAKETGLPDATLMRIAGAHIDELIAAARQDDADADAAAATREQQVIAWNEEILGNLRVRYGARDAEEILGRAQRFIRAHPKLATILQSGLGSEPAIFDAIAHHVHSTGWR